MKLKEFFQNKHGTLLKNTVMLYVLQGSAMLLSFIAVPYETRVLGEQTYALIGASMAIMLYVQLVVDFGFILSATEDVSRNRADLPFLCRVLTSVTVCKVGLALVSGAVLATLAAFIPSWRSKYLLLMLFFGGTVMNSFMPDFLYRGLEKMTAITVRTVLIRVFFTAMIFLFLRKPADVWMIPTFQFIGNAAALAAAFLDLRRRFSVRFVRVTARDVWKTFRRSLTFFFSRFATTAYTAMNTVILDLITGTGVSVSYYTTADKLISTGKSLLMPISDSMYPYMTQHRDFKLMKKLLLILEPLILVFCTVVFLFAPQLCALIFGEGFRSAGYVLRALLPVAVVVLPSYLLGFPTMTAMGISKHANYSVIFGSALHILMLGVLFLLGKLTSGSESTMIWLAATVSVTESVILLYRIVVVIRNREKMKQPIAAEGE